MNLRYESQGSNTFLVYDIREEDTIDSMSLGMLTNNHIDGIAQTFFTQMDDEKYIKFNVSAKVSAAQVFEGLVNRRRLIGVFNGIIGAMQAAEEYMLDPASFLLDLNYIFVDVTTYEAALICLPIENPDRPPVDLGAFCKNIIFNTQYDQTENCDHVAQILNYLNKNPVLVLDDFKNLLDNISRGGAQPAAPRPQPEAPRTVAEIQKPVHVVDQTTQIQTAPVQTAPASAGQVRDLSGMNVNQRPQPQIPPRQMPPAPPAPPAAPGRTSQEKPISLMYLLQHYNKENAAAYKAQKEAKKNQKAAESGKPEKKEKKEKKTANQAVNVGYAIPGQQVGGYDYPIPGQPSQPAVQQPVRDETQVVAAQPPVPLPPMQTIQSQPSTPINFGETTVLGAGLGETTVLDAVAEPNRMDPHLIRLKNNEKISISKPSFRIGKERSYVDYFIGDNTAISRSHANIELIDGEYYVVDTNSTNHTYVNGGMIQSNQRVKLAHGTKIRLANEDFEFRVY